MSEKTDLPARPRRATAKMVADLAGVSRSAVSRAFTKGGYVEAEKRNRIFKVAAEIGYQPNALAAGLQNGRSNLVAVVVGKVSNPHDTGLVHKLCEALNAEGVWPVLVSGTPETGVAVEDALRLPLDALIVRGGSMSMDLVHRCAKLGIPMICYGRPLTEYNVDSVYCQNRAGMRKAAELLLGKGRRRFAFLSGPVEFFSSSERRLGVLDALTSADASLVVEAVSDFTVEDGRHKALSLLEAAPQIDALLCANDALAIGALTAARECALRVPDDISIVGFDDIDMSGWPIFDLTTVRNPLDQIVKGILDLMHRGLNGQERAAISIEVDPQLVLRGTH